MEYIETKDGIVTGHYCGAAIPKSTEGTSYVKVCNFTGYIGVSTDWLDSDGQLKSVETLVSDGIIEDNRGDYYQKSDKSKLTIVTLGESVPDGYTELEPGNYDYWDDESESWVTDAAEKLNAEKELGIKIAKSTLADTDWIVSKIAEKQILGEDISSLLAKYSDDLAARATARKTINSLETE